MTLLVRMLVEARDRRSRLAGNAAALRRASVPQANAKSQAERTTAMLTIIVAVFLITELPQGRNDLKNESPFRDLGRFNWNPPDDRYCHALCGQPSRSIVPPQFVGQFYSLFVHEQCFSPRVLRHVWSLY